MSSELDTFQSLHNLQQSAIGLFEAQKWTEDRYDVVTEQFWHNGCHIADRETQDFHAHDPVLQTAYDATRLEAITSGVVNWDLALIRIYTIAMLKGAAGHIASFLLSDEEWSSVWIENACALFQKAVIDWEPVKCESQDRELRKVYERTSKVLGRILDGINRYKEERNSPDDVYEYTYGSG
jgi:hypothetical protein